MKLTKLFIAIAAFAVIFTSCNPEVEVTGVSLDETTLSVAVNDSAELVATILPTGAKGDVTWTSSNTTIATVENGKVKGVKIGTANIIATVGTFTATCAVTVTKEVVDFQKSLTGTEYYIFMLDGVTAVKLGTKIKADLRPDGLTRFLYIWPDTGNSYTAGTTTGPNFYGEVESWTSLIVGSIGWSGAGINVNTVGNETLLNSLKKISDNPDDYYLHIGIKSKDNTIHTIILGGQTEVKFAIGASGFVDNDKIYPAIADFDRNGEWQQIEIPMKTLTNMGLSYSNFASNPNVLAFLSGGITGKTIDLDAVFIYKK